MTRPESEIGLLPPCDVLRDMVRTGMVPLGDGREKVVRHGLRPVAARALYDLVSRERPQLCVEVGMAQGISTLSILTALSDFGGRLISIDPYPEWKSGKQAALHAVERAGFSELHQHLELPSFAALPQLLSDGLRPGLAYIDGDHDYDHVFIDFFYLDRLLTEGGVLGFNDAGWPDVFRVVRYLEAHRSYSEVDVGLRPDYKGRNPFVTVARWILRRPRQDRYFRKG